MDSDFLKIYSGNYGVVIHFKVFFSEMHLRSDFYIKLFISFCVWGNVSGSIHGHVIPNTIKTVPETSLLGCMQGQSWLLPYKQKGGGFHQK